MIRQIIHIDEEKCNGCGICANACHESAIEIVNGKAKLIKDDYCDGLGDCLPTCPTGAISFVNRDAAPYDEKAVMERKAKKISNDFPATAHLGCPGSMMRTLNHNVSHGEQVTTNNSDKVSLTSQLNQWPCQIKLAPVNAPYFDNAKLLIAADCTAYAYANMHQDFMKNHITLIGCPKLDNIDYSEKLTEIIRLNNISSVTIVRMEVPCCGNLEIAAKKALQISGKFIPWNVVTISIDGNILDKEIYK